MHSRLGLLYGGPQGSHDRLPPTKGHGRCRCSFATVSHDQPSSPHPLWGTALLPPALKGRAMAIGTVKWFNEQKGYGFIQPDQGGKDVFVHISAVERSGLRGLAEGQKVSYEVEADRRTGKESATNLRAA